MSRVKWTLGVLSVVASLVVWFFKDEIKVRI